VLVTDDERLCDPLAAILALPRGSLVVLRARERAPRISLAKQLIEIAREKRLGWIVADDPELAIRLGADGVHFPERKISLVARWRVRRPDWLITSAAHSLHACIRAKCAGASAALLSPVFPTASHPGTSGLGSLRARSIARTARLPVYALGGVNAQTAKQLTDAAFAGLAAIDGLAVRFPDTGRCTRDTANV
jgi:thiamine-phosphate pyrophosphorylase